MKRLKDDPIFSKVYFRQQPVYAPVKNPVNGQRRHGFDGNDRSIS